LRQHFHERFDQWLDEVEAQLPKAEPTLAQVSETIWSLRQGLTASVAQTILERSHRDERNRQSWKHVQALFPDACWVAPLTRLYQGHVGVALGGLRRMQPTSEEAAKAINSWVHLHAHRCRTHYGTFRRGGYPLGSGGIESSNKCICHVRLKRSSAWWYEARSNPMLVLRCAKYNGTFDQVLMRYRQEKLGV
jgi:hypothetical protein